MAELLQWYLGWFFVSPGQYITLTKEGGSPVIVGINSGWYYLRGTDTIDGFAEDMTRMIQSAGEPYTMAEVTLDQSTGKFTIDTNCGGNCTIDWSGALELQALMGFGTTTGSESYTAPVVARYQWRPSQPLASISAGDIMRWWAPSGRSIIHVSGSGSSVAVERAGRYKTEVRYDLLPKSDVWITPDESGWEPLEQFFEDVIRWGRPIKCYPDRTLSTEATTYEARCIGGSEEGIGDFRGQFVDPVDAQWDGLWTVRLQLIKYIVAS